MSKHHYLPPSEVIERYRTTHQVQGQTRGSLASAPEAPTNCTHTQEQEETQKNTQDALYAVLFLLSVNFLLTVVLLIKITLLQQ